MTDIPEMKKWALVDLDSAKQEFSIYCETYEKLLSQVKSEINIVGLRMSLQLLREDIYNKNTAMKADMR